MSEQDESRTYLTEEECETVKRAAEKGDLGHALHVATRIAAKRSRARSTEWVTGALREVGLIDEDQKVMHNPYEDSWLIKEVADAE